MAAKLTKDQEHAFLAYATATAEERRAIAERVARDPRLAAAVSRAAAEVKGRPVSPAEDHVWRAREVDAEPGSSQLIRPRERKSLMQLRWERNHPMAMMEQANEKHRKGHHRGFCDANCRAGRVTHQHRRRR